MDMELVNSLYKPVGYKKLSKFHTTFTIGFFDLSENIEIDIESRKSILKEARALLAEKGWTQETFARDADGNWCDPFENNASCFCVTGALERASLQCTEKFKRIEKEFFMRSVCNDISKILIHSESVKEKIKEYGDLSLAEWNDMDGRTQKEVIEVLDKTISLLEETR